MLDLAANVGDPSENGSWSVQEILGRLLLAESRHHATCNWTPEPWSGRLTFPSSKEPCLRRRELNARSMMREGHLQELDMSRGDKSVDSSKQRRQQGDMEKRSERKGVARAETEARAWAAASKLHSGGKKTASRRKLPSGPLGGSGRKTNLARSS